MQKKNELLSIVGYSALLGSIAGVMLVDYFLIRRRTLSVDDLYLTDGRYSYGGSGINWRAIAAVALGIAPNVPGFITQATAGAITVPEVFNDLYTYAWFVSLAVAGTAHWVLSRTQNS